jgi:4-hydroxymandelate oxidase
MTVHETTAYGEPLTIDDYERRARALVPPASWDYLQGGSGSEWTLAANLTQFDRYTLRPRVLVDVESCDTSAALLGATLGLPVAVAPMAYHRLVHPDGESATVRAAGEAGALFVASFFASESLETIAREATGPVWLQLYWPRRREVLPELAARAEEAGYRAIVLTVDAPQLGRRIRDMRNSFSLPDGIRAVNLDAIPPPDHYRDEGVSALAAQSQAQFDPTITWADLAWLRERSALPLVLKGLMTGEDARLAAENGVDAIVVSNHGGRQLDGAPPCLAVLPEVLAAVPAGYPVLVDGGVRRGTDIVKALALGAKAVMVGRPVLWGLAHAGQAGAAAVLGLLREELENALMLLGRPRLADLGPDAVAAWPPV